MISDIETRKDDISSHDHATDDALLEAVNRSKGMQSFLSQHGNEVWVKDIETLINHALKSQDNPMTKDEILKIMYDGIPNHWQSPTALSCMKHGMIALIRANILYVEEK